VSTPEVTSRLAADEPKQAIWLRTGSEPPPGTTEQGPFVRTFSPKPADITRAWHLVDADEMVLGRLSTEVAAILRGKHKPIFAPHVDTGDHVVVINAAKVVLTAGKADSKLSHRHSGYPGGLTTTSYARLLEDRPEEVVRNAIRGMLPKNRLGRQMLEKLKVYAGPDHPHAAQAPAPLNLPGARRMASTRGGA
jgi:large subunit ribosomal protein L13